MVRGRCCGRQLSPLLDLPVRVDQRVQLAVELVLNALDLTVDVDHVDALIVEAKVLMLLLLLILMLLLPVLLRLGPVRLYPDVPGDVEVLWPVLRLRRRRLGNGRRHWGCCVGGRRPA